MAFFVKKMPTHGTFDVELSLAKGIIFTKIGLAKGSILNCRPHTIHIFSRDPPQSIESNYCKFFSRCNYSKLTPLTTYVSFQMYQLLCCIVCCKLLFSLIPTTHARKKRTKSYHKYLASLKKANELLLNHNIEFEKLHALFNRLKKRVNKNKPRHRRKRNIHVNYSEHLIMPLPTNVMKCRIYCRSGLYLQLLPNGLVKGTANQYDPHGKYLISFTDVGVAKWLRLYCFSSCWVQSTHMGSNPVADATKHTSQQAVHPSKFGK